MRDTAHAPAGSWGDSGTGARGNIVKLLAFLRNETEGETERYLGTAPADGDSDRWRLRVPTIAQRPIRRTLPELDLPADYAYLETRGISATTQRAAGVLYDANSRAIVLPWRLPSGELANVKYRQTFGKTFWYAKGGWPIREIVYGIDAIYRQRPAVAVICEAEIDALTVREAGYEAVAVGGVAWSEQKRDMIVQAPVSEWCVVADNDPAGARLAADVIGALKPFVRVSRAYLPAKYKDANEAGAEAVAAALAARVLAKGYA